MRSEIIHYSLSDRMRALIGVDCMAFESLTEKLSNAFKKLRSKGKLTESDVKEAMREVRLALLEADVNFKVAKDFTNRVTEKAIGAEILESLTPGQQVVKLVNDELLGFVDFYGSSDYTFDDTVYLYRVSTFASKVLTSIERDAFGRRS